MSSADSSNVLKTSNINFKTVTQHPGKYRYLKIPLNNQTGNQVTLDAVSSTLLEWKLPAISYSLCNSLLNYNIELAAPAAKANWAFNDTLEIAQNLTFGTAGGLNLVDIQNVNDYIAVARKIDITDTDYLSGDVTGGLVKADLTAANYFPPGYTPEVGNIFNLPNSLTSVAPTGLEPQYVRPAAGVTSKLEIQRTFPLSAITGTLFSMPQDQFFGADNMYLRIQTAVSGKVGYIATAVTNPITGAAVLEAQPVVKNIYLYLAVEKDQVIIDSLMQKYHSGQLKYMVPFTYTFKYSTVGAGSNSIQVQLNSQYGRVLKRMLHSVFPASETLNSAYDHSNWSGSKITSYQTFVDSQPLQDAVLNCVQPSIANPLNVMDDFRENRSVIRRSGAISSPACYQNNWFHCDKFAEPSSDPAVPDSQVYDGLDLTIPKSWSINVTTTAANYTHYCWGQFLRQLDITPTGPMWI
jgi:hypothetical protein